MPLYAENPGGQEPAVASLHGRRPYPPFCFTSQGKACTLSARHMPEDFTQFLHAYDMIPLSLAGYILGAILILAHAIALTFPQKVQGILSRSARNDKAAALLLAVDFLWFAIMLGGWGPFAPMKVWLTNLKASAAFSSSSAPSPASCSLPSSKTSSSPVRSACSACSPQLLPVRRLPRRPRHAPPHTNLVLRGHHPQHLLDRQTVPVPQHGRRSARPPQTLGAALHRRHRLRHRRTRLRHLVLVTHIFPA